MKAISSVLLGFVAFGSAEGRGDFYFFVGAGALSSFKQSTGPSPTIEIGVWKPLAVGDRSSSGIYVGHGAAKTTVRPNSLLREGETPILLTHLLMYHAFELADSWTQVLECGFSVIGFDRQGTSLSLAGLGFGVGVGYKLWKDGLLILRARYVAVSQSYRGDPILHRQLAGSVGLAVPVDVPGF